MPSYTPLNLAYFIEFVSISFLSGHFKQNNFFKQNRLFKTALNTAD